jgi:hypothetical protein
MGVSSHFGVVIARMGCGDPATIKGLWYFEKNFPKKCYFEFYFN